MRLPWLLGTPRCESWQCQDHARYLPVPAVRKCRNVNPYHNVLPTHIASPSAPSPPYQKHSTAMQYVPVTLRNLALAFSFLQPRGVYCYVAMSAADSRLTRGMGQMREQGGRRGREGRGGGRGGEGRAGNQVSGSYTCLSPKRFNASPALRRVLPPSRAVL